MDLTLTAFVVFVLLSQVSVRYLHSAHGKCLNREKKRFFFHTDSVLVGPFFL